MQFELLAADGAARRGKLALPHGVVDTPEFMPVGTYGTVKTLGADFPQLARAQRLDRAVGADRHECGRVHRAVRKRELAAPRRAVSRTHLKLHVQTLN